LAALRNFCLGEFPLKNLRGGFRGLETPDKPGRIGAETDVEVTIRHVAHLHPEYCADMRRVGAVVVAAVVLLAAAGCAGGATAEDTAASQARITEAYGTRTVAYDVTGTATGVSLTYTNGAGQTEQASDKALPLTSKDTGEPFALLFEMRPGDFAYLSAQNTGDSGSVTCRILIDGKNFREATSDGAYVIASCHGSVP
jgi:hypothetical protein